MTEGLCELSRKKQRRLSIDSEKHFICGRAVSLKVSVKS